MLKYLLGVIYFQLSQYTTKWLKICIDSIVSSFIESIYIEQSALPLTITHLYKNWNCFYTQNIAYGVEYGYDKYTLVNISTITKNIDFNENNFIIFRKGFKILILNISADSKELFTLRGLVNFDSFLHDLISEYNDMMCLNELKNITTVSGYSFSRLVGKLERLENREDRKQPLSDVDISKKTLSINDVILNKFLDSHKYFWENKDRFCRYDLPRFSDPLEFFYLNDASKEGIRELEFWLTKKKWFVEKELSWKLGWCLYGDPGTGKSSFIRNIGVKYDLAIFSVELGSFDDPTLINTWESIKNSDRAIIIAIEDIDSFFNGRESLIPKLSFSTLLNLIQGISDRQGIFLIITTNDLNKLDYALGGLNKNGEIIEESVDGVTSRPGRVNRIIKMTNPDESGRRIMAEKILDSQEDIERVVSQGCNDTGAQFKYRCQNILLEKLKK